MSSTTVGLITVACTFGGALFGLWLQKRLPSHHLGADSQETVKLGSGMIATITALVLGLLVSSAKSTFDTINDGIKQVGAKTILLDRVLAQYGPSAQPVRDELIRAVVAGLQSAKARGTAGAPAASAPQPTNRLESVQGMLRDLAPQTDGQRLLAGQAHGIAADLAQTRWLLMEESHNELPLPLLAILVGWLGVLFVSFGLFSPRNGTVITVLWVCACSMAAAVFLIMELNRPLDGFFKVSHAPLTDVLKYLGH